ELTKGAVTHGPDPLEYSSVTWHNATEFLIALVRCDVLVRHHFAMGESDQLARIRDTWREPRITKGIVQRRPEVFVQGFKRIVRTRGVINVDPSLRRTAADVPDDSSIRPPPRQPHGGS